MEWADAQTNFVYVSHNKTEVMLNVQSLCVGALNQALEKDIL